MLEAKEKNQAVDALSSQIQTLWAPEQCLNSFGELRWDMAGDGQTETVFDCHVGSLVLAGQCRSSVA